MASTKNLISRTAEFNESIEQHAESGGLQLKLFEFYEEGATDAHFRLNEWEHERTECIHDGNIEESYEEQDSSRAESLKIQFEQPLQENDKQIALENNDSAKVSPEDGAIENDVVV